MAQFREIPTPTYDYDLARLADYYRKALRKIDAELKRLDLTDFQRAQAIAMQKNVGDILSELNDSNDALIAEILPKAVADGVVRSIIALGVAETVQEAQTIVTFNRLNKELVKAAVADTQADLLEASQNVERRIRSAVRRVTAEVMRTNLTTGINGTSALTGDVVKGLRKELGEALNTGIVDAAGRRWKPQVYAEMVVRTKMARAQTEAAINEGVGREAYYGIISSHGASDACRKWEGRIVKLVRQADGDYPYIGDLPNREIFHPNCRHTVTPVRVLDYLPDDLKELNGL